MRRQFKHRSSKGSTELAATLATQLTVIFFWVLHIPMAAVMRNSRLVALAHVCATVGLGLIWATSSSKPGKLLSVVAYIAGVEVLWRASKAPIPWESGKYIISALLIIHGHRFVKKRPFWPVMMFLFLIPAAFVTFYQLDWFTARRLISFNLSGPFCIATCSWFAAGVHIQEIEFRKLFIAVIAAGISITTFAVLGTFSTAYITFATSSNFVTSGGFGPNQVSAVLSLAFVCGVYLLALLPKKEKILFWATLCVLPALLAQSVFTFSRTGLVLALSTTLVSSLYLLRNPRLRILICVGSLAFFLLASYVIFPILDEFTDGMLKERYSSFNPEDRSNLATDEINVWTENPLFGVGAGMVRYHRAGKSVGTASHTEVTRLAAEHGLLGLVSLILLAANSLMIFTKKKGSIPQAMAAGMLVWVVGFQAVSGLRLALPGFALMLFFLNTSRQSKPKNKG